MIIPDINVLVHAYNSDSPRHPAARRWWEHTLSTPHAVGLPWVSILGFIRVMTHRGIMANPMYPAAATERVQQWLGVPTVNIITPGERHAHILFGFLQALGTAGNLTTDAHLASLAVEYRAELASTDSDFARFSGLRWVNPLIDR
jgi:toxin-antitoxin system PIN domain toxin